MMIRSFDGCHRVVLGVGAACAAKDVDAIADLYCTDATHAFPFRDGAPVIEGREAIRGHLAAGFAHAPMTFSGMSSTLWCTRPRIRTL